jgi:hypothetical protein
MLTSSNLNRWSNQNLDSTQPTARASVHSRSVAEDDVSVELRRVSVKVVNSMEQCSNGRFWEIRGMAWATVRHTGPSAPALDTASTSNAAAVRGISSLHSAWCFRLSMSPLHAPGPLRPVVCFKEARSGATRARMLRASGCVVRQALCDVVAIIFLSLTFVRPSASGAGANTWFQPRKKTLLKYPKKCLYP